MLSTEAGGEGRNFQFCHILVNYDLPWNPMKVEQRIGRIDRIGQKHPVKVFNFSTLGTVEERVVDVLDQRIGVFQQTIGGLDPILGEVEHDLRKIFVMAEDEADRALADLEKQLGARVESARKAEEQLADLIMDAKSFRKDEVEELLARRGSAGADEMRRFVLQALQELEVRADEDERIRGVYRLRFSNRFETVFPQFAREEIRPTVTFDAAVALEFEEIEFLAFGHPLVDALVERARSAEYPARTSQRIVLTDEEEEREGWLFVYVLEFGGISPTKELYAAFIDDNGVEDQGLAGWLLQRSSDGRREEWGLSPELPERDARFEAGVAEADKSALLRLVARQTELVAANETRLDQERTKLERFYAYRVDAETEKLAAVQRVFERLSDSEDPGVRQIVPVWAKKLENARRKLALTQEQRDKRLDELAHLNQVGAQHERLVISRVEIRPDATTLLDEGSLAGPLLDRLRAIAGPTSPEQLAERVRQLREHGEKLRALDSRVPGRFDSVVAFELVDALTAAGERDGSLSDAQRALLRGAIDYFMTIEDVTNDLEPGGFDDDRAVVNAVLRAIQPADH
jgi:hypothetical protein